MLMRNHELGEGIEVKTEEGEIVGTSVTAARRVSDSDILSTFVDCYSHLQFYLLTYILITTNMSHSE